MVLIDQIKDFQKRLGILHEYLNIEEKKSFIAQEELKTQKNNFYATEIKH